MSSIREEFYLRDRWTSDGRDFWAKRGGVYMSLDEATKEAKRLANGIGKGACVQVVRVSTEVVAEVSR